MSANNWGICPQCKAKTSVATEALEEEARKAYGVMPEAEYHSLVKKALHARQEFAKGIEETFREDYGLGVAEDFSFYVSYGGRCSACGLGFEFKHNAPDIRKKATQ